MAMPNKPHIVALVQARMSSSRLPGKVLKTIHNKPMLAWVVERTSRAHQVDEVAVATTFDPADEAIESWCKAANIACYRGSMFDVLDRFYQAAKLFSADVIVRVTADCPVIDPQVIDETVDAFFAHQADFAANRLPPPWGRTYPIGLDTEVCSFAALELAWKNAKEAHEREHVMPYLYDVADRFKVYQLNTSPDYGDLRWTVDTAKDLVFMQTLFGLLPDPNSFTWLDVLEITNSHPELAAINADVRHKVFNEVDARMNRKES
jgi:spore coat polysaccharide biosynthesis protein SpsF